MTPEEINALIRRNYGKSIAKEGYFLRIHLDTIANPDPKKISLWLTYFSTIKIFELDTLLHTKWPDIWPVPVDARVRDGLKTGDSIMQTIAPGVQVEHWVVGYKHSGLYNTRVRAVHIEGMDDVNVDLRTQEIVDARGRDIEKDCSS